MLLHTALQTLREHDDTVSADTLLSKCQSSTFDLCQILFEFSGKTIMQPCRDLFEKAIGLSVSHSTSSGFLTRAESESAIATPQQHDLIGTHINAVRPNTFGGRGRGNGKNSRHGAKRGAGRGGSQLRHLQPIRTSAPPSAPPSTSSASQQQHQQQQQQQQQHCQPRQAASRWAGSGNPRSLTEYISNPWS